MAKQLWRPGNMLYPTPVVIASVATPDGRDNLITLAWTGTLSSSPAMAYISVRPERYSYQFLKDSGEFVINLVTSSMVKQTDLCGVKSGRDIDKFAVTGFTKEKATEVSAPMIGESPVNIECRVREIRDYGSHHMFAADVVAVHADERFMDEKGRLDLKAADLVAYNHGEYVALGKTLGTFGFSVRKKTPKKKK